jgi:hypothetical protein
VLLHDVRAGGSDVRSVLEVSGILFRPLLDAHFAFLQAALDGSEGT